MGSKDRHAGGGKGRRQSKIRSKYRNLNSQGWMRVGGLRMGSNDGHWRGEKESPVPTSPSWNAHGHRGAILSARAGGAHSSILGMPIFSRPYPGSLF
eukprot:scaffold3522_cov100-Isochrysis_galbana.AAC.2